MISILRNEVERLRPLSNELAVAVEQFKAAGGQIEEGPASGYIPKPITYSSQMPPAPKPFVRRRVEPIEPPPPTKLETQIEARNQRVARVIELAPTHTQKEVAIATGIGRRTLLSMSKEFGFSFKRVHHLPNSSPEHKAAIAKHELILAERIKAYKELGISRRQVCEKLHITNNTLKRLLDEHEIDYPLSRAGGNRCAA